MRHHRDVGLFEPARLKQPGLAAPRLLGGRAEEVDAPLVIGIQQPFGERHRRAVAHSADEVVAAGVAYPGQGVVLGAYPYARPFAVALVRDEGGRQPFDLFFYLEALFFKQLDEFLLRLEFLHLDLGIVVEEFFKLAHVGLLSLKNFGYRLHCS